MAIILVLCLATDRNDSALAKAIPALGKSSMPIQPGIWMIDTLLPVEAVRDALSGPKAGSDGQVLVFRLAKRWAGHRIDETVIWLKALERVWTSGKVRQRKPRAKDDQARGAA